MTWYYVNNGEPAGPISDEELLSKLQIGAILPATLVWRSGMAEWQPAEKFTDSLQPLPAAPPASLLDSVPVAPPVGAGLPPVLPNYFCTLCGTIIPADQLVRISGRAVCAGCKPIYVQQAVQGLDAPLKVPILGAPLPQAAMLPGSDLADPFTRLIAHILDSLFVYLPFLILYLVFFFFVGVTMASNNSPEPPPAVIAILFVFGGLALAWMVFYWTWFIARGGATPGMRIMKIRMVRSDRSPISMGRALGRFVLFSVINQCSMGLTNLTAFFDAEKRTMVDMLCDTRVVRMTR